jgi:integrase
MRHTHATHALARGAELTTVRDNLRHASIATTSIYLQGCLLQRLPLGRWGRSLILSDATSHCH